MTCKVVFLFLVAFSFCTIHSQQQYCVANVGPGSTLDSNLGPVYLTGNTISISDVSNCPGTLGVVDFTVLKADLSSSVTYNLTYNATTCGGVYPTLSGAWIDYNMNYVFETHEQLAPFSPAKGQITIPFRLPEQGITEGSTRMRVQIQETYQSYIDPCGAFSYGGTKDFTIILGPRCTSGPTEIGGTTLGPVTLIGDGLNIGNTNGCPTVIGPQDFTNLQADVTISHAYTITYSVLSCNGTQNPIASTAWIDWNQNGAFEEWEEIIIGNRQYGNISEIFKVPVSTPEWVVKSGKTRLRVQVQETSSLPLDPCYSFRFGGTKDFSIIVNN